MAEEVVDFALKAWKQDSRKGGVSQPPKIGRPRINSALNDRATTEIIQECLKKVIKGELQIPEQLLHRYGADAIELAAKRSPVSKEDPEGFPYLEEQLRYSIRSEMVLHLEDFYLRRVPLFASRKDHGMPWADHLAGIWAQERGLTEADVRLELERLKAEIQKRSAWEKTLG
jgi:glycerol-3-phosphate dehydrogenase